jgi:hypothetical protein
VAPDDALAIDLVGPPFSQASAPSLNGAMAVRRARVRPLRREEEAARIIVSRVLGLPVIQYDDGSQAGMYDLRVLDGGRTVAGVEVTQAADAHSLKLSKLANHRDRVWTERALRGGWSVTVDASRSFVTDLRSQLPAVLATLEATNRTSLEVEKGRFVDPLSVQAHGLGVLDAWQSPTTSNPGSIYLRPGPGASAGFVAPTGDAVAEWIGTFLAKERPRVAEKLSRSGVASRHAFVWVPVFTTAPFGVIEVVTRDVIPVPLIAPEVPFAISDVWVCSMWSVRQGLRWGSTGGWSAFDMPSRG